MKILLAVCLWAFGFLFPVSAAENYTVEKDIRFKRIGKQDIKLDLYLPKAEKATKHPLLVWVHGGAWKRGSKDAIPTKNPLLLASALNAGYALASVDYRLSGEATFPAPVADINDAINYLSAHADQHQIDTSSVIMMGRSAGGHLASLIGATNGHNNIGFYTKPHYKVVGVVSFFGPTDLLSLSIKGNKTATERASVSRFLGAIPSDMPELARQASPTEYITPQSPPFLLMHGDLDKRVPLSQSELLKTALDKHGVESTLLVEEGVGHSAPIFDTEKYVPRVITFLNRHLPVNTK